MYRFMQGVFSFIIVIYFFINVRALFLHFLFFYYAIHIVVYR